MRCCSCIPTIDGSFKYHQNSNSTDTIFSGIKFGKGYSTKAVEVYHNSHPSSSSQQLNNLLLYQDKQ
ncbi:MAG: hypothetical protein IPH42_20890 [Bacteroidetes bacterium]|nr:hypothetical protein [Bacteroidota bacterium]